MDDSRIIEEDITVSIAIDDGSELLCDMVAIFNAGDYRYIALSPKEGPYADTGEIFIYRLNSAKTDEDLDLINIEDDDEFEMASQAFEVLMDREEFNAVFGDE
ncbi:MAG: DUF1292 domain-containing protein [Lachnospiraceae bacterium]|nr:DUF1292 domain-containing protein [Lachnospiraceae bacterium]